MSTTYLNSATKPFLFLVWQPVAKKHPPSSPPLALRGRAKPSCDGDRRRYGASPDSADAAPAATASATQGPAAEGAVRERNPPAGDRQPPQGPPARHERPSNGRVRPPRLRVCQVRLRTASCDSEFPRVPAAPAPPVPRPLRVPFVVRVLCLPRCSSTAYSHFVFRACRGIDFAVSAGNIPQMAGDIPDILRKVMLFALTLYQSFFFWEWYVIDVCILG